VARTLYGRSLESAPDTFSFMMREPAGVAAVIVPWNAPVILLIRSLAPALAAGCTVVVKPAPQTPLSNAWVMARLAELVDLPKGVVNSVNEDGTTVGRRYVASDGVDVVSFTGSSETGKRIMAAAAPTLKRLSLELGGKAPSIVFPDADLDQVVPQLVRGGLLISGQMCIAITRVLVHASIADALADRLVAALRAAKIGPGEDPATQLAPLIDHSNRDRVAALAAAAHEQGEVLLQGKACDGDLAAGAFVSPTLVRIDDPTAALVQEEVFGPLLTLETFDDEDHAIALANNSRYGLSSSLWSRDVSRCFRVARRIESGTVWLNSHGKLIPEAETGGFKHSGIGRLHGVEAMNDFLETKHIYLEAGA
jgi:acyl-CoA reductase-like NAD-dependent aldehyde dehydrogenase